MTMGYKLLKFLGIEISKGVLCDSNFISPDQFNANGGEL